MAAVTVLALGLMAAATSASAGVVFSTFVNGANIAAAEGGNQSTIAFNYTGNGFVGSVYFGPNNSQLYSTNLSGGNVVQFGQPIPGFSGEVVIGVGLGQSGFAAGAVYAGNGAGNQIYFVPHAGAPVLFGSTLNGENIRQIFFDPGNTFGGKMLVSTTSGGIYSFDAAGHRTLIANVGTDTEGMDIASSAYGKYAGYLLVASEGSGQLKAISPGGVVTTLKNSSGAPLYLGTVETISVVPLNLGLSGNPLEGFYVANYPYDIQVAGASQFAGLQGDAIVTQELGSNSPLWDLHYNGDSADSFTLTQVGAMPNQSEDGIFVTAQRINDITPTIPEPGTLALVGVALVGLTMRRYKKA
jgi:hypothetical protein